MRPARLVLILSLGSLLGAVGCTSSPPNAAPSNTRSTVSPGSSIGPGTTDPGTTATTTAVTAPASTAPRVSGTTAPDRPLVDPSTTIVVVLPPVQHQESATGRDANGDPGAAVLNKCLGAQACGNVNAPLVQFPGAELPGVDFGHATLTGADFREANLGGANFDGAYLGGSDFSGANLSGASLAGAELNGVTLKNTRLIGTDLRGANLFDAIVDGSDFSAATFCKTTWVDGRVLNTDC